MHATYLSEVFEADELDLMLSQNNNGHFCVLARKPDEKSNVYLMEIAC
jgi:hypothetical protein